MTVLETQRRKPRLVTRLEKSSLILFTRMDANSANVLQACVLFRVTACPAQIKTHSLSIFSVVRRHMYIPLTELGVKGSHLLQFNNRKSSYYFHE
jgi:hypothetical protein